MQERVERVDHATVQTVLHRHQAIVDVPAHHFLKNRRDVRQRNMFDAAPKFPNRRQMRERAEWSEEADLQRFFQRE